MNVTYVIEVEFGPITLNWDTFEAEYYQIYSKKSAFSLVI